MFEWYKYSSYLKKAKTTYHIFRLPFIDDGTVDIPPEVKTHALCTWGLLLVLGWGLKRLSTIRKASNVMGVMPTHPRVGKKNYNSIEIDKSKIEPLMRHFKYLLELGEVRATRTVSTLVNGMQGGANRDNDNEAIFLPRYMGYRNCYKQYMSSLGYNVRTLGSGVTIVEQREDGEPEDLSEYVSFPTYFYNGRNTSTAEGE
jgi:hypothetical protein